MLGWEGLGFTSFFLVIFYYNWNRVKGAHLTLVRNRVGDALIIIILFLNNLNLIFFIFFFVMAITKSALYPFRSWLPAAIAAPTPVSALVHSRTLVTAGIVIYLKFSMFMIQIFTNQILNYLGMLTILLGALRGVFTIDLKKLVAFSTLRQLGFMAFMFYFLRPMLLLCYILTHAFIKSIIFTLRGLTIMQSSTQNLGQFLSNKLRLFCVILVVSLNFIRAFFFSVFFVKENIMIVTGNKNIYIIAVLCLFSTITLLYILRFIFFSFKKKLKK